jgi:hypothetical protein
VTTDFIKQTALFTALLSRISGVLPLSGVTEAGEAPLAVVGTPPQSGLFAFDKFSSAPFIMDAVRNDVGVTERLGTPDGGSFCCRGPRCTGSIAAEAGLSPST